MKLVDEVLEMEPLSSVRKNHALEHATLNILEKKLTSRRLAGFSDAGGFWLIGDVPTDVLLENARQALKRLQAGEHELAMHANCGTNVVASGLIAGSLAWLGMVGAGKSFYKKVRRIPLVALMVMLGYELGKPLGPKLQQKMIKTGEIQDLEVLDATCYQYGTLIVHRVRTRSR
jgi:ABC-type transport system involved in cytochrome bd biosynthesis fused ATPase/permease subunit